MSPALLQSCSTTVLDNSSIIGNSINVDNTMLQTVAEPAQSPGPLSNYLSEEGKLRNNGTLRSLVGRFQGVPDVVSLSAGFPPSQLFPLSAFSFQLTDGTTISLPDITAAQQYNASLRGYPPLVHWCTAHVKCVHKPPNAHEKDIVITNGANHSLELITSLFLERGDYILVEEYTYPVILESISLPKGFIPLAVATDSQGITPESLSSVLEQASQRAAQGGPRMPKLLYTVPTGHNPTGCSISPHRRQQVYSICRQYDVWIVEDDPYFYLQWNTSLLTAFKSEIELIDDDALRSVMPGLQGLTCPPNSNNNNSYLSLDVDSRVIRVDSFSKFLAPGMRLGWITARSDVVEKLTCAIQTHTVGPCSISQAVVSSTLAAWKDNGLDAHLRKIQAEYARRCAILCCAAQSELKGLVEFNVPRAGMFLWVKFTCLGDSKDATEVWDDLHDAKIIVCPGRVMSARKDDANFKSPYVRISYSSVPYGDLKEGMRRLASVLSKYSSK